LAGERPRICAAIVNRDLEVIERVEPLVDLFEVRIDLIGDEWRGVAERLKKPWIACNRSKGEGGGWHGGESERIKELLGSLELGAGIVDIELSTPGVEKVVREVKGRADCLLSYHDLKKTPAIGKMREIIKNQLAAGADICKVVTTACSFKDNLAALQLIKDFPKTKMVSFAMGMVGQVSRVLCPMVGGYFTYASIEEGKESAAGQITAKDLREIYRMLEND
jgi:3-dehydroquinate dehydratase type I